MIKQAVNSKNNGITLIALVVTIIVLMIIAGVSASVLTGDNAILKQANNSSQATDIAADKEELEIRVLESFDENKEELDIDDLKTNLRKMEGIQIDGNSFPLTVTTANKNTFTIDREGNVRLQENE